MADALCLVFLNVHFGRWQLWLIWIGYKILNFLCILANAWSVFAFRIWFQSQPLCSTHAIIFHPLLDTSRRELSHFLLYMPNWFISHPSIVGKKTLVWLSQFLLSVGQHFFLCSFRLRLFVSWSNSVPSSAQNAVERICWFTYKYLANSRHSPVIFLHLSQLKDTEKSTNCRGVINCYSFNLTFLLGRCFLIKCGEQPKEIEKKEENHISPHRLIWLNHRHDQWISRFNLQWDTLQDAYRKKNEDWQADGRE